MKINYMGIVASIIAFISLVLPWWTLTMSADAMGMEISADVVVYLYQASASAIGVSQTVAMELWFSWAAFTFIVIAGIAGIVGSVIVGRTGKIILIVAGLLALLSIIVFAAGLQGELLKAAPVLGYPEVGLFSNGSWSYTGISMSYSSYLSSGFALALIAAIITFISLPKHPMVPTEGPLIPAKTVAVVSIFAALTVGLNLWSPKIPYPYLPFLIYQIWEIPIVAAFILYGFRVGFGITIINTALLLAYFPGMLPTGPFYNLAAVLSMLFGMYIIHRFTTGKFTGAREAIFTASSTALGIITRVGFMTIVNWTFLPYPPPFGYNTPTETIIAWAPLIGFFNATLALYTIPIGYFIARAIGLGTKTPIFTQRHFRD